MFSSVPMPMQRGSALLLALALVLGALVPLVAPAPALAATPVFINEIHYDNDGTDEGEGIEVAGPAGTDLAGWSIVLYNGANGAVYDTTLLSGPLPDQQNGYGTASVSYPSNGIQNGSPDGVALVNGTTVVQFLSYEGTFTAAGGPADGMTSVDIDVEETATTPVDFSLQLTGTGTTYEDFDWAEEAQAETFDAVNSGQTFGTVANQPVSADCGEAIVTAEGEEATTTVSATDPDGTVTDIAITSVTPELSVGSIEVTAQSPATEIGGTATATITVDGDVPAEEYEVAVSATNEDAQPQAGPCTLDVIVEGAGGAGAGVVISEFRVRGPNGGNDEFIELYNAGSAAAAITDWEVWGSNASGTVGRRVDIAGDVILQPGCFYLFTNRAASGYSGPITGDQTYATGITDTGGIAVRDASDAIVDQVGLDVGSAYQEGTPLEDLGSSNLDRGYERLPGGSGGHATDTNDNSADFALISPSNPQNGGSTCIGDAPADEAPEVDSTTPPDGAVSVQDTDNISITFSEPVDVADGWYDISCTMSGAHTATVTGGTTTFVLDPDPAFTSGDACTVTIDAESVTDRDGAPDAMAADHVFGFSVGTVCGNATHFIHQVQGDGDASPIEGRTVTIEGVVVGDHQGDDPGLSGFFLQEEDGDADGNAATSEGIFVFDGAGSVAVELGDLVSVTGTVVEFFELTEITDVVNVTLCPFDEQDPPVATPAVVNLPDDFDHLERFEGMLVTFEQTLTVTETFDLARFGELVLSANGRQYTGTHSAAPGEGAAAAADLNLRSRITLDDADGSQNDDPIRYPTGGLSATNTIRAGATVTGLTAVMDFDFGEYKLQPVGEIDFAGAGDRPGTPPDVGGRIQVGAFNVLNYFNGDGAGGGFPTARGAETQFEFDRQHAKIVDAIAAMDAEVVGLMEIENDGGDAVPAVATLVDGLNREVGARTYAYVETGVIGTDAIAVAIIYQPDEVSPVGDFAILDSSVDPRFDDEANRPMLTQTFTETATGASFTVAVNHLKSKGSDCGGAPDDQPDSGGGNCNGTRTDAAEAIVDWLASDPTGTGETDAIVIGDLNAYAMEDPIVALENGGYTDLLEAFVGPDAYTYVFFGAFGYLDHALSSATLTDQVTGAAAWHINADEPPALDYNVNFKSPNHVETLYDDGPFRSSDHDPVIVGLDLDAAPVITSIEVTPLAEVDEEVTLSATFTDVNADEAHIATVDWGDGTTEMVDAADGTVSAAHAYESAGLYTVTLTVTDSAGLSDTETFEYAVVYDPDAGFVTGGGRIDSDAGTATFGISVKYEDGGSEVSGDVKLTLPGLTFESTSVAWLVVDKPNAWVHGEGTVNGQDGYAFLAAVSDGRPDMLRVRIWNVETGEVVFDNQGGNPMDAEATEPIRNGQIKVH